MATPFAADETAAVVARARAIAVERLAPLAAELDRHHRFPVESFRALADVGLLGVTVPTRWGGLGGEPLTLALSLSEIARACASTAVGASVTNMVAETLCRFGSEELIARFVPRLTSGEAVTGSFCLSEPAAGSDAASLRATAVRDGDDYVLDGTKMWITSGAYSGVFIVMARTAPAAAGHKGISAFVLTPDLPGFGIGKAEEKTGLLGSNTVPITLDGCRVPAANLIGEEGIGFRIAMTALDGGRITIGAMANGIARAALAAVREHLHATPTGPLRTARKVAYGELLARTRAAELLVERAAVLKGAALRGEVARYTREAAMAKLFATENAKAVTTRAVELLGAAGVDRACVVERLMRDARVTTIFEGTSEVQRLVIGREVLRAGG
ncbi:MAG: acyl-CoA dehydrogenase [Deltaproteobacteria bacterium]|nr:MAG: acyl-CoA dehydrogenase [Deltaproteobacteria bacterium]